jgi:cytochrome b
VIILGIRAAWRGTTGASSRRYHKRFEVAAVSQQLRQIRVWDAPIRLFHWALVVLLGLSWFTESRGWMELHFLSGYSVIALLLFRVAWGIVGSETARFSHFVKSPLAALRNLAHLPRREPDVGIGHNAAGGWMVLAMLALLAVQVTTGLCANDDAATEGPLFRYVGKDWSDWLSHIHAVNFKLIQLAVLVHVGAILAYAVLKRHDLVRPMITGRKHLPDAATPPALVHPVRAIVLFAIAVAAVGLFANAL